MPNVRFKPTFQQQLNPLLILAARDSWAARELIERLAKRAKGNPVRTAAFIDHGLVIAPAVAAQDGWAARVLIEHLANTAKGDPVRTAAVIDQGLVIAPTVAAQDGPAACVLIEHLVAAGNVDVCNGVVCREFMLSAKGGTDTRSTLILFQATPEASLATTGCFKGSVLDLQKAVNKTHPSGTRHRPHYERVLTTIFDALSRRESLPTFRELVRARQNTAPVAA